MRGRLGAARDRTSGARRGADTKDASAEGSILGVIAVIDERSWSCRADGGNEHEHHSRRDGDHRSGCDSPTRCDACAHRRTWSEVLEHSFAWAELLEPTFAEDVLRCPRCGGRRHRIATITDPLVARRILRHIGARYEPLPLYPRHPPIVALPDAEL